MSTFEKAVIEEVTKKALKDVDMDAMAMKLKPVLVKKIEQEMLNYIENNFYWDEVFEAVSGDIEEMAISTVKKALGVAPKPKTPTKGAKK